MGARIYLSILLGLTLVIGQARYVNNDDHVRFVPRLLSYQGFLTDDLGNPITNSSLSMSFAIFDAISGGNQKWSESQIVSVTKGVFSVLLGSINEIPDSVFAKGTDRWLELTVDVQALSPRTRITTVGYAYQSTYADTAEYARSSGGGGGSGFWAKTNYHLVPTEVLGLTMRNNAVFGSYDSTHMNFGTACTTGTSGSDYRYCTVSGGFRNRAILEGSTVSGGMDNVSSGNYSAVAGGETNVASGGRSAVGGGGSNQALMSYAIVAGGQNNTASGLSSTVGGGYFNQASNDYTVIAGGSSNIASMYASTVCGGEMNLASADYAFAGAGFGDTASGYCATVSGGTANKASGRFASAGGRRAKANHAGSFVWADSTNADFASTGGNQFLIRASGGVGVNTNSPTARLDVIGTTGYNQVRMRTTYTPTGSADTNGNIGDIAWDANYVYIKTAAGWKRAALSTW